MGTFFGDPWENLIVSLHGRMKIRDSKKWKDASALLRFAVLS
jgi:hypothetical protein